ncbi:MAG: 3-oxoacyl-ACP synthase III family protein [Oligoflexales bacterium]
MGNLRTIITGTGHHLPERIVTNDELAPHLGTTPEWISQRCGIEQRHWVNPDQSTSEIAHLASLKALENAKIEAKDLDYIIVATVTPDHEFPGTACFLQKRLEVSGIPALDVRQQCTGFIYGLELADSLIKTGRYKNILFVCSEVHSKCLDLSEQGRSVSMLFGDGAGAVIIQSSENENPVGILSTSVHADGSGAKDLWCPAPGTGFNSENRLNPNMLAEGLHYPHMNGRQVFVHAVRRMTETLTTELEKHGLTVDDPDIFLFHQANIRIIDTIGEQLKLPKEKVFNSLQTCGNTTAATIPIGLDRARLEGKIPKNALIAMTAFGSGYTWGSSLIRWTQ